MLLGRYPLSVTCSYTNMLIKTFLRMALCPYLDKTVPLGAVR